MDFGKMMEEINEEALAFVSGGDEEEDEKLERLVNSLYNSMLGGINFDPVIPTEEQRTNFIMNLYEMKSYVRDHDWKMVRDICQGVADVMKKLGSSSPYAEQIVALLEGK